MPRYAEDSEYRPRKRRSPVQRYEARERAASNPWFIFLAEYRATYPRPPNMRYGMYIAQAAEVYHNSNRGRIPL